MAAPEFDSNRSIFGIELSRIIERGLKESRAIDTEALCIVAGLKVWSIRLDIHVLDNVGNLIDCCSIGAITALHHFRRPDVTIGEQVIIHPIEERDPVPLSIHHIPLCITFGIFLVDDEAILVVDPQWKEENVMKGRITMILNIHRELCGVQKAGGVPLEVDQILRAAKIAMVKVNELTAVIKEALHKDSVARGKEPVAGSQLDNLMTYGIGMRRQDDKTTEFCSGRKSTRVKQEEITKKHVTHFKSTEDQKLDYEEFLARYIPDRQSLTQEAEIDFEKTEEVGDVEEEGDEILKDEFNLNIDLNEENKT